MNNFLSIVVLMLLAHAGFSQAPEISKDGNGNKVIKGFITKQELATDSAFAWFAENQKGYTPEQNALNALRANKDSINIIAFGGTWCGDTKNILPKFFVLADAAGLPQDRITLLGVDHSKKTIQHLSEAFVIVNVPTIIVMKEGKEVGRVVEYGKTGKWDVELAELLK